MICNHTLQSGEGIISSGSFTVDQESSSDLIKSF